MRAWHILAPIAVVAACHLDRLVNGSGGGGGGGGGPPPPGPPTTLVFTVQPRGAMPDSTIKPPVQVTARDSAGNTATNFTGTIRVAIATDGSALKNAKLVGDTSVTAVGGVATFAGLSIDQVGTGYSLSAALATGGSMGTSAPFDVDSGSPPPPPSGDLTVTTTTSGPNQPSGYTVTVDGGQSRSIGVSGSVTYTGLTATAHSVQLGGIPSNCTVSEANPQTASVPANGTGQANFTITCTAPNQPPTAAFTSSCGSLTCTFTSTSSDPDGSITSYQWAFGDGATSTSPNPSHTYTAGGAYTVTLTVTDNQGATGAVSHSVTVTAPNQPPVVTAGGSQSVVVGAVFTLSGASFSDPDHNGPWTVTIEWGDGSSDVTMTSNEGSIAGSHSYVTLLPATYTVTITVTDSGGMSGSSSKTVNVTTL